ncbi:hypothetical protein [Nocardioides sp. Soil805]|uniref:hypothetical protein n=1 Tax=Nocardioides sp. Soil805 TaxID=1736416 RepID=UPI00070256CD|nr:hypothetical protein [Nocardioides sp. Soil805]KRF34939.1 hypothetical protein ASG94_12380 [Nocardioides sp. Soil805]
MSTQPRPRQTTFAGGMIVLGSLFLLVTVWDSMTGLRGIESRDAIEDFLSDPPGNGLGLTVEGTLQILRGVATVTGVCAAVAAVLGVYALRGQRAARVGLTVLAVPIFVTGIVAGGFMSSIVAVAIGLLWLSPSREWFRGEPVPDRTPPADAPNAPKAAVWPPPLPDARAADQPPTPPSAAAPPSPASPASPAEPPVQHGTWPALPPVPAPTRRPEGVLVAFVVTVVSAGLVLLLTAISVAVMAFSPDALMDEVLRQQPELAEQGVTQELLQTTTFVMGGIVIAWAAAAVVLAFLTLARRRAAAQALTVSATFSAILCVVGTFASLVLALPAFASIITVAVLRRPEVRVWLAGDRP